MATYRYDEKSSKWLDEQRRQMPVTIPTSIKLFKPGDIIFHASFSTRAGARVEYTSSVVSLVEKISHGIPADWRIISVDENGKVEERTYSSSFTLEKQCSAEDAEVVMRNNARRRIRQQLSDARRHVRKTRRNFNDDVSSALKDDELRAFANEDFERYERFLEELIDRLSDEYGTTAKKKKKTPPDAF